MDDLVPIIYFLLVFYTYHKLYWWKTLVERSP